MSLRTGAQYLEGLREHTAWIDIRGLLVGTQKLHRFSIGKYFDVNLARPEECGITAKKSQHPAIRR